MSPKKRPAPYEPAYPTFGKNDYTQYPDGDKYFTPDERTMAQLETYFSDGIIDANGKINNAINRNTLIYGRARDASPEYWKFVERINKYATQYPTADPRVWVPLAQQQVEAGTLIADQTMTIDAERLGRLNAYDKPRGGKESKGAPTARDTNEDEAGPTAGWLGDAIGGALDKFESGLDRFGEFFGSGESAPETTDTPPAAEDYGVAPQYADEFNNRLEQGDRTKADWGIDEATTVATAPIRQAWDVTGADTAWDKSGLDSAVNITAGKANDALKWATRNTFASLLMPVQAIEGTMANMADDLGAGDWKSLYLHGLALNPVTEAMFIAAENLTGTQFYREGGNEQTNWSQTDKGQQILDLTGQGLGEQLHGADVYNDQPGIQSDAGDGFVIPQSNENAPTVEELEAGDYGTVGEWQRAARLNANTILPEQEVSKEHLREIRKIARLETPEAAMEYAWEKGYQWDKENETLFRPAQGWTLGRAAAIQVYDPYTEGYNNMSGAIDFVSEIVFDPIMYIPGGQVKAGFKGFRGGGKWAGGVDDAAVIGRTGSEVVGDADDILDLFAKGMRTGDVERSLGGKLEITHRFPESSGHTTRTIKPEELDTLIDDLVADGYSPTRAHAAEGLKLDGYNWEVRRNVAEVAVDETTLSEHLARAAADPAEKSPNLTPYVDSGMGGATKEDKSVVGWTRIDELRDMSYNAVEEARVARLTDDIAENGVTEPLVVIFDPSNGRMVLGEGNHRLAALEQLGEVYAPIRVVRGHVDPTQGRKAWNAKSRWKGGMGETYWPSDIHPRHILGDVSQYGSSRSELMRVARDAGGYRTTRKVLEHFNSEQGKAVLRGLVDETNGIRIWLKSDRKIDLATAYRISLATDEAGVMEALAPKIGGRVQYKNDLAMFADLSAMPGYRVGLRTWKATHLNALKEKWLDHIPGTSFLPGTTADVDNIENLFDEMVRFGRVADTGMLKDEVVMEKLQKLLATSDLSGPAARAARYEAVYGIKGQKALVDGNGHVFADHVSVRGWKQQGMTEKEILDMAGPGSKFVESEAGVIEAMMDHLVAKGRLKDQGIARKVARAWSDDETMYRHYEMDTQGFDWAWPWMDKARAQPGLEADLLGRVMPLPNIHEVRKAVSRWQHLADKYAEKEKGVVSRTAKAAKATNDLADAAVQDWKLAVLMVGGIRLATYTFRALADTMTAIALSGGSSVIRNPQQLMGWVLASAVRAAQVGENPRALRRAAMARSLADNPLLSPLWADELASDIMGNKWVDALDDVGRGVIDHDSLYWFNKSMNHSAGVRGGFGADVRYVGQGQRPVQISLDSVSRGGYFDPEKFDLYADGLSDELWRLSQSPTAVKVAQGEMTTDELVEWFLAVRNEGAEAYSYLGPEVKALANDRQGAEEIIKSIQRYINEWTGGDEELVTVIARGGQHQIMPTQKAIDEAAAAGKAAPKPRWERIYLTDATTGDRALSKTFKGKIKEKFDDERIHFPQMVRTIVEEPGYRSVWNNWNRKLFHIAGKWEDVYAREPFYKERYYAHILDQADLLAPAERADLIAKLIERGDTGIAKKLSKIDTVGHFTQKEISDVAAWRAQGDIIDVAYNAANRREWAYAARLISPFAQAAVNGMYRWAKAAVENPESTYRVIKGIDFLAGEDSAIINDWLATSAPSGAPVLYENEYGERRIGVPAMGILGNLLVPGPEDTQGAFSVGASSLNFGFPAYERASLEADLGVGTKSEIVTKSLFPGVGPMVSIPLSVVSDGTSEWARDYLQPYGAPGQGWENTLRLLVPGSLAKMLDAIMPDPEEERRRGARVLQYYAMLVKEQGGLQNMSRIERNATLDRANNLAWRFSLLESASTFGAPGSVNGELMYKDFADVPDHWVFASEVQQMYRKYLDASGLNYEEAEARFVQDVGLDMLLLTGPSGFDTDAAPPTRSALAVKRDYEEGYDEYSEVLNSLLPDKPGVDDFSLALYSAQSGYGERIQLPIEQRVKMAQQRIYDYLYDRNAKRIAESDASDPMKTGAMNSIEDQLQKLGWDGQSTGRTRQEKQNYFDLMQRAARDPRMIPFIGEKTANYIDKYIQARNQIIDSLQAKGLKGDLANIGVSGEQEKFALFSLGETWARKDENFFLVWYKAFRSEVVASEEEPP